MKIRDRVKELRRVPAGELLPNERNWRKHPKAQQEALQGILAEIGYAGALIAYETPKGLKLIDGHLRASTTPETEVPVLVLDVDDAEAAKLLASLDPLAAMAEADAGALDSLLRDVQTGNQALADMLTNLAEEAGCEWAKEQQKEVIEDEVPEPPTDPVTKPGDLWVLGEHRLLCGDSANADDVKRLMNGKKVTCVFTDPPYGVNIGAKNRLLNSVQPSGRCLEDIATDDLKPEDLKNVLVPAFKNLRELIMDEDCTLLVSAPQGGELGMMMMMMMMESGLKTRHVLVWKKNQPTFSMGRLDYDYQHEPILLTWLKKHKKIMKGKHTKSVWDIDRERKCADHPTMKPVEIYANAYLNHSDDGDNVADIYSGSGTAFIAAEQLGRTCYGMEISPAYCDVIVARWEKLTGKKGKLEQ